MWPEFMFLTVLVPGPRNPEARVDVFLQPLIAELNALWSEGVETYDISLRQNFQMHAALLWTINDFPAYSMLSGWKTAGRLACPLCMEDSDAFTLPCSGKQSWFDNHRKFLPTDHPFRRNTTAFIKGKRVSKEFRGVRTGESIVDELTNRGFKKLTEMNAEQINGQLSKTCGWSKRSIF